MSNKIHSPHDNLFKSALAFKEVALDFYTQHIPTHVQEHMNFTTMELCKNTFLDTKLKTSSADVLYRLQINDSPGYIYTLLEHQSSVDSLLAFRLLGYVVEIMRMHLKEVGKTTLPVVYCVVFYTGQKPYTATLDLFDLFGENKALASSLLFKSYQLINVNEISDDELSQYTQAGFFEFVMKHIYERDFSIFLEKLFCWINAIELQFNDSDYLKVVLEYTLDQAKAEVQQFKEAARRYLSPEWEEKIMTFAQHFRQEGMEKGVEKGRAEGTHLGIEKTLEAAALLQQGMALETVARKTGLTLEDVAKINSRLVH